LTTFRDFPSFRAATAAAPSDGGSDSLSSSYEEKKQSMSNSISGLKRSSPNDVTIVPEVKHRNPLDTSIDTQVSNGEPTPSRLYSEFQIDEILGSGIFGTVYRVHCRKDVSQVYAIKRSRRQYRGRQDKHKMLREVDALEALSRLSDLDSIATIVKYISYWVEDHYVCIQMELCDCSVEAMLASNPIQEPDIFVLLHDILLALSTLHRHEYVHLDVKPANIMRKAGRYKLGDFGLAVHTNHGQAASNAIEEGDCRYMARELLDWGPVQDLSKCDIFSLGITAYEIVTHIPSPVNGPQWHALRDGSFALPARIGSQVVEILSVLLTPSPHERPSAVDCLNQYFLSSSNDPTHQRNFIASLNAKLAESLLQNQDS
jgi:wee1-like protein kinase